MRLRLRVFGRTLLSFTYDRDVVADCYEEPVQDCGIGGGSSHNFERSVEYFYEQPEERGFGFQ